MAHNDFDQKYGHLLNDNTRIIPDLNNSTNIQELLGILQHTGTLFKLNEEANNTHHSAYDTVQYIRFLLKSSSNETNL